MNTRLIRLGSVSSRFLLMYIHAEYVDNTSTLNYLQIRLKNHHNPPIFHQNFWSRLKKRPYSTRAKNRHAGGYTGG